MDHVISADDETVLDRDGDFERIAVAHHVKGAVTNDGEEPDHAQHGGLTDQDVAANLLILGNFALFAAAYGGRNVNGGVQGLDLCGFRVDGPDQLLFRRFFQYGGAHLTLDRVRTEQASTQGQQAE